MSFQVLSPREASIFTCVTDTILSPEPKLPPVTETIAVEYFDSYLTKSPKPNRIGFRAIVLACELAPQMTGFGARLRRLDPENRAKFFNKWSKSKVPQLRVILKLMKSLAAMSYYGDTAVMEVCGYDPVANVARGRALREKEKRP